MTQIIQAAPPAASDATVLALVDTLVESYELGVLGQTFITPDAVVRTGCHIGRLAKLAGDFTDVSITAHGPQLTVALTSGGRRLELVGDWA